MMIVGLTGQSGAGKTTVSSIFQSYGFQVINADLAARRVMEKGQPCLAETAAAFGSDILDENGCLKRKRLAKIVFTDKSRLERLNSITFPHIIGLIENQIDEYRRNGAEYVLLDAPVLFEAGADRLCDIIVSTAADIEIRTERIIRRDNIDRKAVLERFSGQHTADFFKENSDFIIENNGSHAELEARTKEVIGRILENNNGKT